MEMSVNGASAIFSLLSMAIQKLPGQCYSYPVYFLPLLAIEYARQSLPHYEHEH